MIDRSDRHRWFSRRLMEAMGLTSLAAALGGASCGGKVTVDSLKGEGAGGSGSTGFGGFGGFGTTGVGSFGSTGFGGFGTTGVGSFGSTGFGGSGGAGPVSCVVPLTPQEQLLDGCIAPFPDGCRPGTAPEVQSALGQVLGVPCTPSSFCCGARPIVSVPCGPLATVNGCCYAAVVTPIMCEGRPFSVDGIARAAETRPRRDWRAEAAPAVATLDERTRRALADAWTIEARYEHASIASFARLALELLSVGAPADLVRDAQRAMGDEIRHAELCFALAGAYAGEPVGPAQLSIEGALGRATLAEMAAGAVREGCLGETIAALAAAEARDGASDPIVRAALDEIAEDEAEHAAMAWRMVAWAHREGSADVRAAIATAFAEPFAMNEETAPLRIDAIAFRHHGRLVPAEMRALAQRVLVDVVQPAAAALLRET